MDSDVILELVQHRPNNLSGFRLFRHKSNGVIESLPMNSMTHPVYGFDLEEWPVYVPPIYPSETLYPSDLIHPGAD